MKLSCTQENFSRGIQLTSHLAGKNTTLPILNNILLRATSAGCELLSTNLEMGVKCFVRGKVDEEGEITVPARLLSDYVSLLPHQKVDLETSASELKVHCENFHTVLKGQPTEEFPMLPEVQDGTPFQVKAEDLKSAVSETAFAVAFDETRPEISGVLLRYSGNVLTCVATDSYRLAERKIALLEPAAQEGKVIIPGRAWQELLRLLPDNTDSPVRVVVAENQMVFYIDDVQFVSRLIEGHYPDYEQIIPKETSVTMTVPRDELVKTIKTASLFSKSGINDVVLDLQPENKTCIVSSSNAQIGENTITLHPEITGTAMSIVFNHRYLLDGLLNMPTSEIQLQFVDRSSPGIIKPVDSEGYVYIVMPIKQ